MKFGKRFSSTLPEHLVHCALPYTPLKKHIKALVQAAEGSCDPAEGDDSGETSSATEGSSGLGGSTPVEASPLRDAPRRFLPTSAQLADFQQRLKDALETPATNAERIAADITTELTALQPARDGVDDERLAGLLTQVESLHCFVVLHYIALFKLVKKWNKACSGSPGSRLAALPLLLPSPLFSSRPLQLLFQRAAKWRHEGSTHGGGFFSPSSVGGGGGGGGGPFSSPLKGGPPSSPLRGSRALDEAGLPGSPRGALGRYASATTSLPLQHAAASAAELGASADALSSGSGGDAGGCGSASTCAPVRCEGCVKLQTRFVVLGCAHTFCWGCVAASLVHQRRRLERAASNRGSTGNLGGDLGGGGGSVSASGSGPPPPSPRALPPTAGGLSRRFSANNCSVSAPWPLPLPADAALLGLDRPLLECPVCDSLQDLDKGHLEVNALLADDSYVWILSQDGERGNRRNSSRSRLAGIDFATLSVYGSLGSSPKGPLAFMGSAPQGGDAGGGGIPPGWGRLARVPSWGSIGLPRPY